MGRVHPDFVAIQVLDDDDAGRRLGGDVLVVGDALVALLLAVELMGVGGAAGGRDVLGPGGGASAWGRTSGSLACSGGAVSGGGPLGESGRSVSWMRMQGGRMWEAERKFATEPRRTQRRSTEEGRKEGRKKGRKKARRKGGREEGREIGSHRISPDGFAVLLRTRAQAGVPVLLGGSVESTGFDMRRMGCGNFLCWR